MKIIHISGMSWEYAHDKWGTLSGKEEGFWISHQVRNNKKTAVLAVLTEGKSKDKLKNSKKDKLFNIYRPNTGQAVKVETLTDLKKKYKKCSWEKVQTEAKKHWSLQFDSSEKQCSHAYW